jgi:thermostable 8-oxoguanine DNA glycosylase
LPEDDEGLKKWLVKVGKGHCDLGDEILKLAADTLLEDRKDVKYRYMAGQAEFLDMLRAIEELSKQGRDPETLLKDMRPFIFQKGTSLSG